MAYIGNDWDEVLGSEFEKEYYKRLMKFLEEERQDNTIYPPEEDVFNALKFSPYNNTKVVILGQDPYTEPGQSSWTVLFSKQRSEDTAFSCQYI